MFIISVLLTHDDTNTSIALTLLTDLFNKNYMDVKHFLSVFLLLLTCLLG